MMNDFYKSELCATFIIHKEGEITADTLYQKVRERFPDKEENEEFSLLYVYYYKDKVFKYPFKDSNVLYIGHTKGQKTEGKKSAGFRFMHLKSGHDYKQNITLSRMYERGDIIGLDVFEVANCIDEEKLRRYEFLNKYGALPIAYGAAYSKAKNELLAESIDAIS